MFKEWEGVKQCEMNRKNWVDIKIMCVPYSCVVFVLITLYVVFSFWIN